MHGKRMDSRPNIVWVTIESTRADHTSLHGYERTTTPELQRLARSERGRAFGQCFSHGIWTLASSASILTGTYPSHHGAGIDNDAIPAELKTVPELLSEVGYETGCISPNAHLSSGTGLNRGFDRFAWLSKSNMFETLGPRILLKYARNVRRHGGGLTTDTRKHNRGYVTTELAKRWLSEFSDEEQFFLYCHLGNPHQPYYPPKRFRKAFCADNALPSREAGDFVLDTYHDVNETIANGVDFDDEEWAAIHAMYDGEIAHTDELVRDLYEYIQSIDCGRTIFVVTADHGELFGERGLLAHKMAINDAVSHVPLVVHGFDEILDYAGEQVQHVDLIRTLIAETGARTDQLQGIDMRHETREHSFIQRGGQRFNRNLDDLLDHNPAFPAEVFPHEGTVTAVRTPRFRYHRSEMMSELYRLPDESTDVIERYSRVAKHLDEVCTEFLRGDGAPTYAESRRSEFSAEMKEQLADLGYLVD
jgi:arylsulfatase A-like enzyme